MHLWVSQADGAAPPGPAISFLGTPPFAIDPSADGRSCRRVHSTFLVVIGLLDAGLRCDQETAIPGAVGDSSTHINHDRA